MYNERNILTMTDEEIISDSMTIARRFNVEIKNLFVSRNNTGFLVVVIDNINANVASELEATLWRYIAGIIDINGERVGSSEIDSPAVSVEVYNNEREYNELIDECKSISSFKMLMWGSFYE